MEQSDTNKKIDSLIEFEEDGVGFVEDLEQEAQYPLEQPTSHVFYPFLFGFLTGGLTALILFLILWGK